MALANRERCKRYLGIRPTVTKHDQLIDELLASAIAMITTFIASAGGSVTNVSGGSWSAIRSFRRSNDIGSGGLATTSSLADLTTQPDYATRIEPQLNQDIVDTVAHLFRQRNPTAASETEGGGLSDSWDDVGDSGLPKRVERRLRTLVSTLEAA